MAGPSPNENEPPLIAEGNAAGSRRHSEVVKAVSPLAVDDGGEVVVVTDSDYAKTNAPTTSATAASATTMDPATCERLVLTLKTYIRAMAPLLLDAVDDERAVEESLLSSSGESAELFRRFISDAGMQALFLVKCASPNGSGEHVYSAHAEIQYADNQLTWVVLMKRSAVLDTTHPIGQQLQVVQLPANSLTLDGVAMGEEHAQEEPASVTSASSSAIYQALHACVHHAVAPLFNAYAGAISAQASQGSKNAPATTSAAANARDGKLLARKKLAELELSLLNLQQNVEIPSVRLAIHPAIRKAVERCAALGKRVTVDDVASNSGVPATADAPFLNHLQADVASWVREIQKVTRLSRDCASGTALAEINFWLGIEKELDRIEKQLKSEEVLLTLDVLKHAKRFHATVSFLADTGLKESADRVQKYNLLIKDFPLNDMLAATELDTIRDAIVSIFTHLNKKIKLSPYPVRRALHLVDAISRDFADQLLLVLGKKRLMMLDYDGFSAVMKACKEAFHVWDEHVKDFTSVAREVMRKRAEKFIPIKVQPAHLKLQERLEYLHGFRKKHQQLRDTIIQVASSSNTSGEGSTVVVSTSDLISVHDVDNAYASVKHVEVLDVSPEGTEIWISAETVYNERVAKVENQIIANLRDRLATARNSNEMFRVFSKFNVLFVRPKIRGAIQEYQVQLIENVKDDIGKLQHKYKSQYDQTTIARLSEARDIPPISGAVMWATMIERQLDNYMKRVEAVLGKGWEMFAEGQKLLSDTMAFRQKLATKGLFDAWLASINRKGLSVAGLIFHVVKNRSKGNSYELRVNFDDHIITLFKEIRYLTSMNFPVPHSVMVVSNDARRAYPYAVSLIETVRTYHQTMSILGEHGADVALLVAGQVQEVHAIFEKGIDLRWESFVQMYDDQTPQFAQQFATVVSLFQAKVHQAQVAMAEVQSRLTELQQCPYDKKNFTATLGHIQSTIDHLGAEKFSNINHWTAGLDAQVEAVLIGRLAEALDNWSKAFGKKIQADNGSKSSGSTVSSENALIVMPKLRHELKIRNQVIVVEPPIECARSIWIDALHAHMAHICDVERLQSGRYDVASVTSKNPDLTTYRLLPTKLLGNGVLSSVYSAINNNMKAVKSYVAEWLKYQALWDLVPEKKFAQLGDDLQKWQTLLVEVKKARVLFDGATTSTDAFAGLTLDCEHVQSKVSAKYDSWQKEVVGKFASILDTAMRETHSNVRNARLALEHQPPLDGCKTAEAVVLITLIQDLKQKQAMWTTTITALQSGQKELERNRYQFPAEWLHVESLTGEWSAFSSIYHKKDFVIQQQMASLQAKILEESRVVEQKIIEAAASWDEEKPIDGKLKFTDALTSLTTIDMKLSRIREDHDLISRAREALEMDRTPSNRLQSMLEEVADLKSVWTALSKVWSEIDAIKDTPWNAIVPRKLRQQLEQLITTTRELPSHMRQYAAFEHLQETLKSHVKVNSVVADLKSDALRERHWKKVLSVMRLERISFVNLTLGQVWDADLRRHEAAVRDVIASATGEMALEEFLRQVREHWQGFSLNLIIYQSKCRLIRGWEDLFGKCQDHLNGLSSMKASPYYRIFEEDACAWEEKLNRIYVLFDVWIDVQRQWVYLEGIFSGSADIKNLLPLEASRFGNINAEFLSLMKKLSKSPNVLDVLAIPGVLKTLEKLADLLNKVQKALGEYLERERVAFPRFFFVGDEDLLEIIGNDKDVLRVEKHLRKMFPGVAKIQLDKDGSHIVAVASAEGEVVPLCAPVKLLGTARANEWLGALELAVRKTMAVALAESSRHVESLLKVGTPFDETAFRQWMESTPAQLVSLSLQIHWTREVETELPISAAIRDVNDASSTLQLCDKVLGLLTSTILHDHISTLTRTKCEHLITVVVHQRDVCRKLRRNGVSDIGDFDWLQHMRFYLDPTQVDPLSALKVRMAGSEFTYGFEYIGVQDKLVQTPLTDRCYVAMTQALHARFGGSPFGPAGTGKTESVKALGHQLGKFVLVFCCDENFDFQAMGRIFVGLCQVGAIGCFDEFNRLDERILSAVSQQVQIIQEGLRKFAETASTGAARSVDIELLGRTVPLSPDAALFITMNPNYAGRSNLPTNLKKLFRPLAMTKPDNHLIAEVLLFAQGFRSAELLASKVVPLFSLCEQQLSSQPHYDWGLRALKSVLVSAGNVKRRLRADITGEQNVDTTFEQCIVMQSIEETVVPKLVADDISLLSSLLAAVFPGIEYCRTDIELLTQEVVATCARFGFVADPAWTAKIVQLYQIQNIHHGVMLVGKSGTGKSTALQVLSSALEALDKVETVIHRIDPKAVRKEHLYGHMEATTREWTDGLFTQTLRKIIDNVRGEKEKRHWIVFDGCVDPEWIENLNSVLDDNKLLTLPNGERLALPPNVHILFEVEDLKHATLATVSRCGMVLFNEGLVSYDMIVRHFLDSIRSQAPAVVEGEEMQPSLYQHVADLLAKHFSSDGMVGRAWLFSQEQDHVMEFTQIRALKTLFSLVESSLSALTEYNMLHDDFPLSFEVTEAFIVKKLINGVVWSFTGDCKMAVRQQLAAMLTQETFVDCAGSVLDFDVQLPTADWVPWKSRVATVELEIQNVSKADVVIPTVDTVRHEHLLYALLGNGSNVILCGPAGSGKTMSLFAAIRKLTDTDVVGVNFSSTTTPEMVLRSLEAHAVYRKTSEGVGLAPAVAGKRLVFFFDEVNLPQLDKYGTQRAISFLRQLMEHGGFWRTSDKIWVSMHNIQFIAACNPPTDPGRVPMSTRFLRHNAVILVDYPERESLKQIYGTFTRAVLKVVPALRAYADPLTDAMVEMYFQSQERFTSDVQAHYVYSPRELTRWIRGIYEAIKSLEDLTVEGLVRVWAHEALRLFQDRLVAEDERSWTECKVNELALRFFPTIKEEEALERPILFSNWLSKSYIPVKREPLREFVNARMKVFQEEELDVELVLFDDVLEHALRIDRVFRQMQGHLLLIGVSGSGKTTLARFVAWMNGISVFQVQIHRRYVMADFDADLRTVLHRAGCKGEKICFIMDESQVNDPGFLERINTLLANAEVPGLFEGEEHSSLMAACKEGAAREGLTLDSEDELHGWFTKQIMKNFHVVFTMNPPAEGLAGRSATSPALFNRCVLDWFGDWKEQSLVQVAVEFTKRLDVDRTDYRAPQNFKCGHLSPDAIPSYRDVLVSAFVSFHRLVAKTNQKLHEKYSRRVYLTPRHYLDFVAHFVKLHGEKRENLEDRQRHLNIGLEKLSETVEQVEELRRSLAVTKGELERKSTEANEKLKHMIADQQQAESKQVASLKIRGELETQNREIESRRAVVMADLAEAEPAVLEAQQSVSGIKKQHLVEVRSMVNPPIVIKLAMESVCVLLNHQIDGWKSVQQIIRRDDFISSIVNYDTEKMMTLAMREKMRADYLSHEEFTFDAVNRASKACGPLVQWVIAQVKYSEILNRVGPLREEVQALERDSQETMIRLQTMETMIVELEASIARYKEEYAALISETQALKLEMDRVKTKVDRSLTLITDLSTEQERWESTRSAFSTQLTTLVGDSILSAAFLAYAGYYDQAYRQSLLTSWMAYLDSAAIIYKRDLLLIENLSHAAARLSWSSHGLPTDDLCVENAIIMQRHNRFPLIIDPSGATLDYLRNEYKDQKIMVSSFLDAAFLKNLESALRFGCPLVITDVESYDPIVDSVLNREVYRAGGRVLIKLGNQEIDFSPTFKLFLFTRDPNTPFSPDISSRVTFVNFSVTHASLYAQCLCTVLKHERPDIDEKRRTLQKLQGEFQVRLHSLETSLLQALSEAKGAILEDDTVVATLENLKREAMEVERKVQETDIVLAEVEAVTAVYAGFARSASSVFFCLNQMFWINHMYRFDLWFFNSIYEQVVSESSIDRTAEESKRLTHLRLSLFRRTFECVSSALLHDDCVILAFLLARIHLEEMNEPVVSEREYAHLIDMVSITVSSSGTGLPAVEGLPKNVSHQLSILASLPAFRDLREDMNANPSNWTQFISGGGGASIKDIPFVSGTDITSKFRQLLLIKACRPELVLSSAATFLEAAFGMNILSLRSAELCRIVAKEVKSSTPLAFCSPPNHDPSYRVEKLAVEMGSRLTTVAMGSPEALISAEKAITNAAKTGTWVLLKNVHLSLHWLGALEKKMYTLRENHAFRLFLTMENNDGIPTSLLRMSRIIMSEPSPGLCEGLMDLLHVSPAAVSTKTIPAEKTRMHFLLAFLHSQLVERLRYRPLGWSKHYDFSEADFACASSVIEQWVGTAAVGKSNIAPAKIPWTSIRSLFCDAIYGGRVDNAYDQRILDAFVRMLFTEKAFESGFHLIDGDHGLLPDSAQMTAFMQWTKSLVSETQQPSWLRLSDDVDDVVLAAKGRHFLSSIRQVLIHSANEETAMEISGDDSKGQITETPTKLTLMGKVKAWQATMPETVAKWTGSLTTALDRVLSRERDAGQSLLQDIRFDLLLLMDVLSGKTKSTNHTRELIRQMMDGEIPSSWRRFAVPQQCNLSSWFTDLIRRWQQLDILASSKDVSITPVWLGGLFYPEAYFTATRQIAAERSGHSIETLAMSVSVGESSVPNIGFAIEGLSIQCLQWDATTKKLVKGASAAHALPRCFIHWTRMEDASMTTSAVELPLYANIDRTQLLANIKLPTDLDADVVYLRGAAVIANVVA